ncbi:MAG TPA: PilZ domain-containing protein [Methylocystis sp.]|nr:PilZ domain-containing protein [Methylocystis sp.]
MSLALREDFTQDEGRRFQRVAVSLFGRYMLECRDEFPCQTVQMSPGDVLLFGPQKPTIGERVVVYLDELGRFVGLTDRLTPSGFSITLSMPPQKRDRLADQLVWFANRHAIGLPEDRRHERIVPIMRRAMLHLPDQREAIVKIKDISLSGVGLETDIRPVIGTMVAIGSTSARVVRHFEGGFACEFTKPFSPGEIDESTRL